MNKDVIYIESEDDITDIITKIEKSKEKIVALVPPKKAGVFRSIVNIKLITKAGANAEKAVVLVTTDPSIIKLAAVTKLPVTKNLRSAPAVPKAEEIEEIEAAATEEAVVEDRDGSDEGDKADNKTDDKAAEGAEKEDKKSEKKDDEKEDKKSDDKAKGKKDGAEPKKKKDFSSNPFIAWIQKHKIIVIGGGIGLVLLVLLLIWANVIAPAVTVDVVVRTTTANFSENVTFTDKLEEENASEGKFYIQEKKIEIKSEVDFPATGKKNIGEKATGAVIVKVYFEAKGSISVDKGTTFTVNNLSFVATDDTLVSWDGRFSNCENQDDVVLPGSHAQCLKTASVAVEAVEPGADYNIPATPGGWNFTANVSGVYSTQPMVGGTDKVVTVVQQSDIDKAKDDLKTKDENNNKKSLLESLSDDDFEIESSFKQTVGDAVSKPALGEQVEENKKAKLTVTTTASIYIVDETKVKEFIKEKAKLADGYKIYEMNDPFIENFTKTETGYIGKLKTSYVSGSEVTAKDVVETVMGKGLGTGRDDLTKAYSGISKVITEVSFPWVTSFPNDEEKITVNIIVEDNNK
ncbi:hypothetical protein IKT18_03035 [Candidatus Saccharibacteria bacterium]|nr:hypothetical protein [Candidatus Saccharibacteria bacterium]